MERGSEMGCSPVQDQPDEVSTAGRHMEIEP